MRKSVRKPRKPRRAARNLARRKSPPTAGLLFVGPVIFAMFTKAWKVSRETKGEPR